MVSGFYIMDLMKNKTLLAALLLSVLLGIFFYDVIFLGKVYLSADAQAARSVSLAIKDKTMFPQHFPYIFSGMPAIMVYTSPYLYFPNVLTTWLPAYDALYASHVLHYLLAGMGMFLLLRSYGFWSGIVGAISFMFTTNMIGQSVYGHAGLMMTATYIPIIFWAFKRTNHFKEISETWREWGIFALLLGLQMQRGHYQIIYYTWMLIGAYFIYSHWIYRTKWISKKLVMLIGCGILAFGMDAMITFPTIEYARISIRSDIDFSYASSWSFNPKEMITFLLPNFYGFSNPEYTGYLPFTHFPNYLGVVTVILACFARGKMVKFLIGVILGSLLISFGKYTPLYEFLYDYLPLFDIFRAPMMILILVQFSVALLAGMGFGRIQGFIKTKTSLPFLAVVPLISLIPAIVLVDLWVVGYKINKTHDLQDLRKTDEIVEFFKKQKGVYRVAFVSPPFNQSNVYAVHGIETVGGYHAAKMKIYQENFLNKDITTASLSYLNVVFIVSKEEIKELQLVGTAEGMNIYLNRNLLSRYFLSGSGNISVLDRGIEYAKLKVTLNKPQTLIFSEIYCPSWKVYVDGERVENEIWRNLLCSIVISRSFSR